MSPRPHSVSSDESVKKVSTRNFVGRYFPTRHASCGDIDTDFIPNSGATATLVSRRKILSRSRDSLNSDFPPDEEDDIWFQKERLFKDHVQEVLSKWNQLDDEIWAKIIVMERNRRVAKAYARVPVLTISGSDDGFDGFRIGLRGFDNPMRDAKTEEIKKNIGHGVKIKMDDDGNIIVKRVSKSNVYVKEVKTEENSIATDIIKAGGLLEMEKPVKLFDMRKFSSNVNKELKKAYPDRSKLEVQCISAISFVKDCAELLDSSCWVMVINVVALEFLNSKLPPVSKQSDRMTEPLPLEENLYSDLNCSGITMRDMKPPKLPQRTQVPVKVPLPLPDYEDWKREYPSAKMHQQFGYKDHPYCCGVKARVTNFGKKAPQPPVRKSHISGYLSTLKPNDRAFKAGRGPETFNAEEYAKLYVRVRPPTRPVAAPGILYVGEWE